MAWAWDACMAQQSNLPHPLYMWKGWDVTSRLTQLLRVEVISL